MKSTLQFAVLLFFIAALAPRYVAAQSQNDMSLGDLARSLRRSKDREVPALTVIDNDNLPQLMDEVESRRLMGHMLFSFDGAGKSFQISSPDVTCSLSFSAQATSLLSNPFAPQDLPASELAKLDGPATISGDTLQLSVYNGTSWSLKEITVGITLLRRSDAATAYYGTAKLVPASAGDTTPAEKRSDVTVLYHLKGAVAPFTTTVFRESLGSTFGPDQDWHWAIVQAKGVPPS
jgi:hypothetical protein